MANGNVLVQRTHSDFICPCIGPSFHNCLRQCHATASLQVLGIRCVVKGVCLPNDSSTHRPQSSLRLLSIVRMSAAPQMRCSNKAKPDQTEDMGKTLPVLAQSLGDWGNDDKFSSHTSRCQLNNAVANNPGLDSTLPCFKFALFYIKGTTWFKKNWLYHCKKKKRSLYVHNWHQIYFYLSSSFQNTVPLKRQKIYKMYLYYIFYYVSLVWK